MKKRGARRITRSLIYNHVHISVFRDGLGGYIHQSSHFSRNRYSYAYAALQLVDPYGIRNPNSKSSYHDIIFYLKSHILPSAIKAGADLSFFHKTKTLSQSFQTNRENISDEESIFFCPPNRGTKVSYPNQRMDKSKATHSYRPRCCCPATASML